MISHSSELRSELQPLPEPIEAFCRQFQGWRTAICPQVDAFAAELLLREALANAMSHGLATKTITCVLRAKKRHLVLAVCDGGKGFDWRTAGKTEPNAAAVDGRGLMIYRHYASAVRFNAAGNCVTLIKRY